MILEKLKILMQNESSHTKAYFLSFAIYKNWLKVDQTVKRESQHLEMIRIKNNFFSILSGKIQLLDMTLKV